MKAMKKLLSLVLAVAMVAVCAVPVFAAEPVLSDTTKVNVDNTSADIYAKSSSTEYHAFGNNYMHMYTTGDYLEINQNLTQSLTAGTYTLTAYIKGTGALWYYQAWGSEWAKFDMAYGTPDENGWCMFTKELAVDGNGDTNFLFHTDGACDLYIDNISLVDANGVDYVKDGGFDDASATNISAVTDTKYGKIESEAVTPDNTYSLHMYTTEGYLEFSQNFTETLTAGTYTLTAYMKGTGALWYYQNWGTEWAKFDMAYGIADGNGWCKFTKDITVDGDGDTSFLFHTEGAADLYIDDVSLVDANGVDYVPDGGFSEVTIPEDPEPEEPEEPTGPVLSDTTTVNIENTETRYAELVDTEYHGVSDYSLHYKTTGDWFEAYQSFTETLPAGTYTFTVYAKGEGEAWYYHRNPSGWGAEWAQIKLSDGEDAGNGWKKYVKEITEDGNGDTGFLIHNAGAADIYFDNMSLVDANGKDYISDGGFDNISTSTTNNQGGNSDTMFTKANLEATVADNTYSMHAYTTGDGIEFSQNFASALPTGTYTLTAYMKGTGAVWYYNRNAGGEWSSEWAKFDLAYGTADADGWCKFTKELTVERDGNVNFLFSTEGACNFYIDDISLVDANGKNYAVYGGFVVPEIPDEPETPAAKYVVSAPEFTGLTADGKLKEGTVGVTVTITNKEMGDTFAPVLIVALYDGDEFKTFGYLQQVVVETAEGESVPNNEYTLTISVPAATDTSDYSLKVMVWDGFDTLNSLSDAVIVK